MFDIFKRNLLWSMAIYTEDKDFSFHKKIKSPLKIFDSKKLRRKNQKHIHTYADPFLFSFGDELYLFYESQAVAEKGKIEAFKTSDLREFMYLGEILKEPHHLSYPFVFENNSSVFLIPESLNDNKISLYKFEEFPYQPVKVRVLLEGDYRDSSAIEYNGTWFLFTTSDRGLEIFYTDDIERGNLMAHPSNPITADLKYSRCGGSPVTIGGEIYRIAQDNSSEYGKNIHILKIKKLSKNEYEEELTVAEYFDSKEKWNSRGGHHFSISEFQGRKIIAVDGKQNDYLVNKFLSLTNKILSPFLDKS